MREMLPDELEHQELVEVGVEQGASDGIDFPVVIMRAPGEVDDHEGLLYRIPGDWRDRE